MKSICIEEVGKVTIKEQELPVRKEGEALLRLLYGGICGSDLSSYKGKSPYVSYPRVPGHEFSAQIVEIDDNDLGLEPGMVVTCNPYFNCGHCYSCQRGMYNCCMTNQTMGVQREGAFSEYITMPVERIYNGKNIPADLLAMIEPFCISYHGMKKAKIQPGEQVLVIGAGTIGVLALVAAKRMGAEVTICDVSQKKLDYAKQHFGADHLLLNSSPEVFAAEVNRLTDGRGFDVVAEAVGLGSTFLNCIEAAAFGGRMVQIGVGKQTPEFDFTMIQKKELQIFGSRNALKEDFLQLIEWVNNGEVDLRPLLTKEYSYLEAEEAFRDLDENNASILKIVFKF